MHAPAVFQVSQSATGQFVVMHPASNTVMVGDDLAATYEQMRAAVAGLGDAARAAPAPSPGARLGSSAAHWISLAALALLPFVWLGALHVSLGRLVAELRLDPPIADRELPGADLRARVERVERQIETLAAPSTRTQAPAGEAQADQLEQQAEHADDDPAEPGKTDEKPGDEKPDAGKVDEKPGAEKVDGKKSGKPGGKKVGGKQASGKQPPPSPP